MPQAEWRLAVASAIGTSHVATGMPCQDYAQTLFVDHGQSRTLIAVVCDGAGSAAHSHVGSRLAAETFADLAARHLAEGGAVADLSHDVAEAWIARVGETLEACARSEGHATRDYACTMLAVLAAEDHTAFIQVGDGAIVVSHGPDDGWSYVFWPQHGEYANTTNFVVSANVAEVFEFELAPRRIDDFALFSDGIENLVLHQATRTVHGSFFDKMMTPVRRSTAMGVDERLSAGLARYLGSEAICDRTDDDKTLILATRSVPDRWEPPCEP